MKMSSGLHPALRRNEALTAIQEKADSRDSSSPCFYHCGAFAEEGVSEKNSCRCIGCSQAWVIITQGCVMVEEQDDCEEGREMLEV